MAWCQTELPPSISTSWINEWISNSEKRRRQQTAEAGLTPLSIRPNSHLSRRTALGVWTCRWHQDTSRQFLVKDRERGTGLDFLNQMDANPDPKPFQEVSTMENGNRLVVQTWILGMHWRWGWKVERSLYSSEFSCFIPNVSSWKQACYRSALSSQHDFLHPVQGKSFNISYQVSQFLAN